MRILLVDDDENLMESLAERLIRQRYAVDIAIDGGSAATYVDLFEYDLIVLDLGLPDGDGITFCRAFRKQGYANPLMILTAKESTQQKVQALDAGADDYVVKPFDFDELCARIRALLRREHQGLPTVLALGALQLDPSACETTYQGQQVRLTPKEFSLMELFLRHPHRVYSLGAIIDDLWSFDDPPGEDAVRTHIKGLRRKLQKAGAPKDLIKTVYGLGYRLNENAGWTEAKPLTQGKNSPEKNRPEKPAAQLAFQSNVSCTDNTANQSPEGFEVNRSGQKAYKDDDTYLQAQPSAAARMAEKAPVRTPLTQQLADAYHRYLLTASDQIGTLETVAAAVEHRSLDTTLHAAGYTCAHKLVGALDSFGVAQASQIARKIETYLEDIDLQATDLVATDLGATELGATESRLPLPYDHQLSEWVAQLRDRIDQATTQNLAAAAKAGLPTVLIVSNDTRLTQQLATCAQQSNLQIQVVSTYPQAETWLAKASFDLVVCDVEKAVGKAIAPFLTTLQQSYNLPVIWLAQQLPLRQRLALVKQGITMVGDRTQPPTQIIETFIGTMQTHTKQVRVAIAAAEPEMLTLFQSSLQPWRFQTTPFSSSTELWQWLNNGTAAVDLLVLDLEMPQIKKPQISGIEFCQILRADARFQRIPILFWTPHTDPDLRTRAYQAGANDFIHQAVAPAELATRLRNQLPRACQR